MSLRDLDFDDSFESNNSPTQGSFNANSVPSFVDDAAFVTAKGSAAADGDLYYNSTTEKLRAYQEGTGFFDKADDADVITNTSNIGTNTTNIGTNTTNIGTNTSDISTNASAITANRNRRDLLVNLGVSFSNAASALTCTLTQSDGSTAPTSGDPVRVAFGDQTITDGGFDLIDFDSTETLVIPSGATMGLRASQDDVIFFYLYYDGTNKGLMTSGQWLDPAELHTTTAIDATADTKNGKYSTVARTNTRVRLVAVAGVNYATPGTWGANPDYVELDVIGRESFQNGQGTVTGTGITNINGTSNLSTSITWVRVRNTVMCQARTSSVNALVTATFTQYRFVLPINTQMQGGNNDINGTAINRNRRFFGLLEYSGSFPGEAVLSGLADMTSGASMHIVFNYEVN